MDEQGIAVRTQWQSGNYKMYRSLKGNRFFGDDKAELWESLPDLSRKLYSVHYPIINYYKYNDKIYFLYFFIKERF